VTTKWKVVFQYQILDAQFAKTIKLAESGTSKGCTGKNHEGKNKKAAREKSRT
jgi:hypothetical protein